MNTMILLATVPATEQELSVWVIFRYTRKAVGHYPTVTPQLPHSYPASGKSVICNRETFALDKRDHGNDRPERQKQFFGTLPVSCNKA